MIILGNVHPFVAKKSYKKQKPSMERINKVNNQQKITYKIDKEGK